MLDCDPQIVLNTALKLSAQHRADLVAALIESLDGEPDPEAEAAWTAEIEKRARRILSGERKGSDCNCLYETGE
ncbi:MAG: addiction module protein [Deltaproteobacteria bacterium]|nr:addiction module protein [Deltaproteobacteria bacterium]